MEPAGEGISSSTILVSDQKAVKLFTSHVLAADLRGLYVRTGSGSDWPNAQP